MTTTYFLTIRKLKIATRLGREQTLRKARGYGQYRKAHRSYSKDSSTSSVMSNSSLRIGMVGDSGGRSSTSSSRRSTAANIYYCTWEREKLHTDVNGNEKDEQCNVIENRKKFVGHKLSCTKCQTSMPLLKIDDSDTIPENEILKKVRHHSSGMTGLGGMAGSISYDSGKRRYRMWKLVRSKTSLAILKSKKSFTTQMDKERKATQVRPGHRYTYLKTALIIHNFLDGNCSQ